MNISDIIIIGGDRRMEYAAEKLGGKYNCTVCGAENIRVTENNMRYDAAVLPMIPDNSAYDILPALLKENACVFAGRVSPELQALCEKNGFTLYSYLAREELAVRNAVLTAEGAVAVAINETNAAISGSDILVLGYGRIAKICARYFAALGANVTAAARKKSDLAWIRAAGHIPVNIENDEQLLPALANAEIIINTVPAKIITAERAAAVRKNALLIELASSDCTDETAEFRIIKAAGLPGKTAPLTAGYIIADTICNIIQEIS